MLNYSNLLTKKRLCDIINNIKYVALFGRNGEKMNIKRVIALLLCLVFVLMGLCACNKTGDGEGTTTDASTTTDLPVKDAAIMLADLKNYTIVRSETASATVINHVVYFNQVMEKLNGGDRLKVKDDFTREGVATLMPGEYEIIIGDTRREESVAFKENLRYFDYGYTMIGKKIVIFGYTDETIMSAIDLFINDVVKKVDENSSIFFASYQAKTVKGTYKMENFTINGNDVKNFTVVYPKKGTNGEESMAKVLSTYLSEATGYLVKCSDDKAYAYAEGNCEILIGATNRNAQIPADLGPEESYIKADGKTLLVAGGGYVGVYNAVNKLKEMIDEKQGTNIAFTLETPFRETIKVDTIKAMSFNVWVSQKNAARDARVIQMINTYAPDVLGVQEASPTWMNTLKSNLTAYACVGLGRDGGSKGEHSAIFYLKDKFTLLEQGTKWLSDTPDVVSKYSESSLNRIFSYAVLKRNSDGKIFVHVNTHFDHTSDTARAKQAAALVKAVAELDAKYPVIMTGDFNCTKGTDAYNRIINAGFLNSSEIATVKYGDGTFHGNSGKNSVIDFCFVSKGEISVTKYRVCNEKINGDYASDHHPVYVEFIY